MRILIAYATKHGSTQGIAERIGQLLAEQGHDVHVREVGEAQRVSTYHAYVVGSAVYLGRWRKEATSFVLDNREVLRQHPIWLFSTGPLGDEPTDEAGNDLLDASVPRELPELVEAVRPREHRVFFGVLDPATLTRPERALRKLPAGRALLPEGDFRDWNDIETWAGRIARQLR